VAVLVEGGADRLSATGGALAAPIGRTVIAAALQGGP
jgi:peptidoglycan glycosyltransferase